jgi:L-aspartate oxidase
VQELVVVGAGAAGLFASLTAARAGARVTLVSARPLAETASYWAQGGLAAALSVDDSPEQHLQDTIAAGRGLVRTSAAEVLAAEAPARFADLEALGVRFDADRHGNLALGLEGGHGIRRVVHAGGSATGRRILRQLSADVVEEERIDVLEGRRVRALLQTDGRVSGVVCDDGQAVAARAVILASGGAAALWSRTTNPPGSYGSGLLLARAAGAELADLEFVQFHPTAVVGIRGREGFLITEAVRGEGATLHDAAGERFVDELQPRDAVARAIHRLLVERDERAVYLDMTAIDPARDLARRRTGAVGRRATPAARRPAPARPPRGPQCAVPRGEPRRPRPRRLPRDRPGPEPPPHRDRRDQRRPASRAVVTFCSSPGKPNIGSRLNAKSTFLAF